MNARIAAFVASRLLALFMLANYATVSLVEMVATTFNQHWSRLAFYALALAVYAVAGLCLWLGAGRVADRVTAPLPENVGKEADASDWMFLAVALTGGLFVLTGARVFDQLANLYVRHGEVLSQGALPVLMASGLLFLVVGVALMIGARTIVKGLSALCAWGNKPFFGESK